MRLPVFAERFKWLRGKMSQADFAIFLQISRVTVGFYENGDRIPDAVILKQIAEKCHVSADYLLGIKDQCATPTELEAEVLQLREDLAHERRLRQHATTTSNKHFNEYVAVRRQKESLEREVIRLKARMYDRMIKGKGGKS